MFYSLDKKQPIKAGDVVQYEDDYYQFTEGKCDCLGKCALYSIDNTKQESICRRLDCGHGYFEKQWDKRYAINIKDVIGDVVQGYSKVATNMKEALATVNDLLLSATELSVKVVCDDE
jgi:hypothetical protein